MGIQATKKEQKRPIRQRRLVLRRVLRQRSAEQVLRQPPDRHSHVITQASGVLARTNTNSSVLKSNQTERMKRSHRSRIDVKFSSEKYTPNRDRPLSSHTSQ